MQINSSNLDSSLALGRTAQYICAARALESNYPISERLFDDPYAAKLAGEYGFNYIKAMANALPESIPLETRVKKLADRIAIRTAFLDKALKDCIFKEEVRQLVIMGVGGDCRAFRLDLPKDCAIYEIDFPEVIQFRTKILSSLGAKCDSKIISIGCDVTKNELWSQKLIEHGFEPKNKCVFLLEGLIMYLENEQLEELLKTISGVSCTNSFIIGDGITEDFLKNDCKFLLDVWNKWGSPMINPIENPKELIEKFGYQCKVSFIGDEDANFGRWASDRPKNYFLHVSLKI